MSSKLSPVFLLLVVASFSALGADPAPAPSRADAAALEARAADLERLIAALEKELVHVRGELVGLSPRRGVTPQEAVEQFKKFPKVPVTVEFGVEPVGYPDGLIREGDDPEPAIIATWDNRLVDGGSLTAILPPKVYRQLSLPTNDGGKVALTPGQERSQVVRHIEEHGIRVTGVLKATGFHNDQYVMRIDDPANVVLYIKGSGQ